MTQFEIDNLAKLDTLITNTGNILNEQNNHIIALQEQIDLQNIQVNYLAIIILIVLLIYTYGIFKKTEW